MNDLEETDFLKSNSKNFGRPAEENYEGTWQPHSHNHNHDACTEEAKEERKRIKEVTIAQILEGDSAIGLPKGLITMMEEYMEIQDWEEEQIEVVMKMMQFLLARAQGLVPTAAGFMRQFVSLHPSYQKDSVVPQRVTFDLLNIIGQMEDSSSPAARFFLREFAGQLIASSEFKVGFN